MKATLEYENDFTTREIREAKNIKEAKEYATAHLYAHPTEKYKRRVCCDKCFYIVKYDVSKHKVITKRYERQK